MPCRRQFLHESDGLEWRGSLWPVIVEPQPSRKSVGDGSKVKLMQNERRPCDLDGSSGGAGSPALPAVSFRLRASRPGVAPKVRPGLAPPGQDPADSSRLARASREWIFSRTGAPSCHRECRETGNEKPRCAPPNFRSASSDLRTPQSVRRFGFGSPAFG